MTSVPSSPPGRCVHCTDLLSRPFLRCSTCTDPRIELCLLCVSLGVEPAQHVAQHSYTLVNDDPAPFTSDTGANLPLSAHLVMLYSIERYNFGWPSIQRAIVSHLPPDFPSSDPRAVYDRWYLHPSSAMSHVVGAPNPAFLNEDHTVESDETAPTPVLSDQTLVASAIGYSAQRDDFDHEHFDAAEAALSRCIALQDDDDFDRGLRLAQVRAYTRVLGERRRRKAVVAEHCLMRRFRPNASTAVPTDCFDSQLRFASQFMSQDAHDALLSQLRERDCLRRRIKQLSRYKRHNITRLDQGVAYDRARVARRAAGKRGETCSSAVMTQVLLEVDATTKNGHASAPASKNHYSKILSGLELLLCSSLGLAPGDYVALKAATLLQKEQQRIGNRTTKKHHAPGLSSHLAAYQHRTFRLGEEVIDRNADKVDAVESFLSDMGTSVQASGV